MPAKHLFLLDSEQRLGHKIQRQPNIFRSTACLGYCPIYGGDSIIVVSLYAVAFIVLALVLGSLFWW